MLRRCSILALSVLVLGFARPSPSSPPVPRARAGRDSTDLLEALDWRSIGPYRGGRVTAVAGVPGQPLVYYLGATGGGVWKTVDGGAHWKNVSDGWFGAGSVGAIAVAPSDPNVVYVGMGESCIRGNVSQGDGVYKSTDGGRTWTHLGLESTRQIGRIRVHPDDPQRLYVAALGHAFGPSPDRGVYRSKDGGATWQRVLFVNDSTGAVDLAMDPRNPRVLYAGFWQTMRTPWSLESGGRRSALYQSIDGGDTWRSLTGHGLPKGPWGRVGVTASGARPDRVWAVIEADDGGLFRSDDAGASWQRVNDDRRLRQRAWYYSHVFADPQNPDGVVVLNVEFLRSSDGGRTFATVETPHGDHHDLWIAPEDARRMINGNDGGANVSLDGGASWTRQDGQPTGQFYHVAVDDRFPYRLYGAQQDNSTVAIASRTSGRGIGPADWYPVGGCESGFVSPKTGDPEIVYAGCYDGVITRYDHRTDTVRDISVYPENPMGWGAEGMKYRFQWTFPILASRHDPNTLYAAANVLFRSTDEGQSWTAISPDLTRNDPAKLGPSGGPITKDNTSVEYYCTIFALAESPRDRNLLWAGSDDGRVHVTRDQGGHWTDVTPRDVAPWSMVSQIDASPHDAATAYLAVNRYKLDDDRPYAYVTHDFGKSWKKIVTGIPDMAFVRVVREDPARRGLLYAGTELGVYVSVDAGARWRPLPMEVARRKPADLDDTPRAGLLPIVPITDLVVKDRDLVASTQGRGFWILDDLSPLRQSAGRDDKTALHLFHPEPAYRFGGPPGHAGSEGLNPAPGAWIDYRLPRAPRDNEEVQLEILDASGRSVRAFSSKGDAHDGAEAEGGGGGGEGEARGRGAAAALPAKAGVNRFAWNLRQMDAKRFKGLILWGGGLQGPEVPAGRYRLRLMALGQTAVDSLEVRRDPRLATTDADDRERYDLQLGIRDKLTETHEAIERLREARDQLKAAAERARAFGRDSAIARSAEDLSKKLTTVEEALYQTRNRSSQDPLNYPIRLNNKLSALGSDVSDTEGRPTSQQQEVYRDLVRRIDEQLGKLKAILGDDLASFNRLVREREVPAVVVKGSAATAAKPAP
ncbi:MAG: glycosyl hydrolase [Candidatus Eisenbacteria bacterium]|uniref:Glycosyl hydrolase n=1 Tax=Eiseniibacteriota bacterium TaxID=2212470 RepID=A0A538U6Y7_UNCEI|nr:MAG: glycosyl hydrolase [Candidatus Eisenbacteria bacterium]